MTQVRTQPYPTRFRAAEERGARLGRPLRVIAGVRTVDEDLMRAIGEGFFRVDEVGASIAREIRMPGGPSIAEGMRMLSGHLRETPDWVDFDLVNEGAQVYRRMGRTAGDVLLQLSLLGGYRFGGPPDLLVATGALTGDLTQRRLAETQHWAILLGDHDSLRPGGPAWTATVHVRLMHALVNHTFSQGGRWDTERWGAPINQSDQAGTLGLFNGVLLVGARALGVPINRRQSHAFMHLWRYVGWLMGVDDAWLFEDERDQHRFNYHVLRAQDGLTDAGRELAHSAVAVQSQLHFHRFARWQRWYEPRRMLSMMTVLLGPSSMRDFGLGVHVPWAYALAVAGNVWRHRILGRTAWGRRRLDASSQRYRTEQLRRYFGRDAPDVRSLT